MNARKISLPIHILLALAVLLSALGLSSGVAQASAGTALAAACTRWHTVQRGEYLSLIARQYGTTWQKLAEWNSLKDPSKIYAGNRLCVSTDGSIIPNTGGNSGGGSNSVTAPSFDVIEVVRNGEVTVIAEGFPARAEIDILMDEIGANAEGGIWVETVSADRWGELEITVAIPRLLRGEDRIAIRLEAVDSSHFTYGWFYNETGRDAAGGAIFPDLEDEEADVAVQRVRYGQAADVYQGNGGVSTPSSSYTGWAWVLRFEPNETMWARGLDFTGDLLEVRILDDSDDAFDRVWGLNYLYFNLDGATRDAFDDGDLDIYGWSEKEEDWVPCEVQVLVETKNRPYGRLACVIESFGLYGLAYH